jgi:hypothetical protein
MLKLKLIYDRQSVGQTGLLLSGSRLQPTTRFFFLPSKCGFLDVGHPLWRENGSVIYFSYETPPTWRARSPYLYPPRNRVAQLYSRTMSSVLVASYGSQGYSGDIVILFHTNRTTHVKVKVTLRPTISRPVRLGVRRPSGTRDQFFYLLEIFF